MTRRTSMVCLAGLMASPVAWQAAPRAARGDCIGVDQCVGDPPGTLVAEEFGCVFVQWVGPPGCPVRGTDFFVSQSLGYYHVTLKTLRKNGTRVEEYIVGRARAQNGEPRDLGNVLSSWPTGVNAQLNESIVVRIGRNNDYPVRSGECYP